MRSMLFGEKATLVALRLPWIVSRHFFWIIPSEPRDFNGFYTNRVIYINCIVYNISTKKVQKIAVDAFKICKCSGVARIDVMLSEENIPYVIEVNSVPGMTETSLVPDAARAAGIDFPELCEKILALADF